MSTAHLWPTATDLDEAARVVGEHLAPTPLVPLDVGAGDQVWLKLDSLQPTGSFKVRGGLAAIAAYAQQGTPVVTASAGNHGLGIAYAATTLGVRATIVVPATASPAKIEALRRFDVTLILEGAGYDDAETYALELARTEGRFVSAYADRYVIAGQSTLVREVVDALGTDLTVVTPVGGGGLASGSALAARAAPHDVRVIGVEAAASRAVSAAVAAGHVVPVAVGPTHADGLAGNIEVTSMTPDILRETATTLVAVAESAIRRAIRLFARAGLVVEGAGAVGLAALLEDAVPRDRSVVLAVTGRNIALDQLAAELTGASRSR